MNNTSIANLQVASTTKPSIPGPICDNSHQLTWSQIQSILKHGASPTKNAMNASMVANNERTDLHVTCSICLEPYHTINVDGQIEKPALAACGHVFGNSCIERWLARPMRHVEPTCPVCRFPLQFKLCKHAIKALDPYDVEKAPPAVLKSDRSDAPASCLDCSIGDLPIKRICRNLEERKANYISVIADCKAMVSTHPVEDTAKYREWLAGSEEAIVSFESELQRIEGLLLVSQTRIDQELATFHEQLASNPVWHLKVESDNWAVPAGETQKDYDEDYDEGDEDDEDPISEDEGEIDPDDREGGSLNSSGDENDVHGHPDDSSNNSDPDSDAREEEAIARMRDLIPWGPAGGHDNVLLPSSRSANSGDENSVQGHPAAREEAMASVEDVPDQILVTDAAGQVFAMLMPADMDSDA